MLSLACWYLTTDVPACRCCCCWFMQLITRMFGTALHGNVLVPLMHFANHVGDLLQRPHPPSKGAPFPLSLRVCLIAQ